jgi:hypothetical protein
MRRIVPLMAAVAMAVLAFALAGNADGADAPRPAEKDLLKLFRFHAAAQAEVLGDAVERAGIDEALRDGLRQLVRKHLQRVDEEAARAAAAYPPSSPTPRVTPAGAELDDFIGRATDLAKDFNESQVAAWLDEHPAAYQPVQEQIALSDAYARAVADEPDAVARAAVVAGLPLAQEPDLRKLLAAAHDRLTRVGVAA